MRATSNRIPATDTFFTSGLWLIPAQAADPIQTQYGISGEVEVDLLSASDERRHSHCGVCLSQHRRRQSCRSGMRYQTYTF